MDDIKSPILKSAIESLEHGLDHSKKNTPKDWRFAILHVDQAVELILKEKLVLMGKSIYNGKKSLNLHETFNELKKQGIIIPEKPIIEEAHNIRNRTQHRGHTFIKEIITYYIEEEYKFVKKFLKTEMNIDISQIIELETKTSFERYKTSSLNKQIKLANKQINYSPADAILSIFEALEFTLAQNFPNNDIYSVILKLKEKNVINEPKYKNLLKANELRHRITDSLYEPSIEEAKKSVKIVDDVTKRINNQNKVDSSINIEKLPEMIEDYFLELEIKDYSRKTIKSYKSIINEFYEFLIEEKDIYDDKMFLRTFKKYIAYLKREKNNNQNSIHSKANIIKNFFEFNSIDTLNEFEIPKKMESPSELLSEQEVKKLINAFDKKSDSYSKKTKVMNLRNKIILTLLYSSGLEASELADLHINDVDLNDKIIFRKNEKDKKITFSEETKILIEEYRKKRDYNGDFLFASRLKKNLTPESIRKIIKRHAKEAGIKKMVNPHILRYSFEDHHMNIKTLKNVYDKAKTV